MISPPGSPNSDNMNITTTTYKGGVTPFQTDTVIFFDNDPRAGKFDQITVLELEYSSTDGATWHPVLSFMGRDIDRKIVDRFASTYFDGHPRVTFPMTVDSKLATGQALKIPNPENN